MNTIRTITFLILAGLAEISGAYFIWKWARGGKSAWLAIAGVIALLGYGIIQSMQDFNFGRVFAAYGGVFIALALLWGWIVDGQSPDRWDVLGVSLALLGSGIILFAQRG
ncbi:MAG: YnfA family protein [Chloroflexota bacterium]